MENSSDIFLYIILMIFLGYTLKRMKVLKSDDLKPLNTIILNVAMPCMIFEAVYNIDVALFPKLFIMPVIPILVFFLIGLIAFLILKVFNLSKSKVLNIFLPMILGNTAYLGYPIVLNIFGNDAFLMAVFFDISMPLVFLLVNVVLIINFGGNRKDIVKSFLKSPILWAIVIAVVFNILNIGVGNVLEKTMRDIGGLTVPLAMIILGASFNFSNIKDNIKIISFISLVKLIIYPAIAFIFILILGLGDMEFKVGILQSAMPSAVISFILAIDYKLDVNLISSSIFLSTVLSFISLPIITHFLL
ncbi:MAG: AEC family transporter [Methanobrevibacter sp.]|jgi:predicted permease|nr:AEC family transporter [Methanobrevibacter sp.]